MWFTGSMWRGLAVMPKWQRIALVVFPLVVGPLMGWALWGAYYAPNAYHNYGSGDSTIVLVPYESDQTVVVDGHCGPGLEEMSYPFWGTGISSYDTMTGTLVFQVEAGTDVKAFIVGDKFALASGLPSATNTEVQALKADFGSVNLDDTAACLHQ